MKSKILLFTALLTHCLLLSFNQGRAQTNHTYDSLTSNAAELYKAKQYRASAEAYSEAFKSLGWKGTADDRYNAACSWALAGVPDSAFFQLERIISKMVYTDYDQITTDTDLNSLHSDSRWKPLIEILRINKEKTESGLNKPLAAKLDSIFKLDQEPRLRINETEEKFGRESKEMQALWQEIVYNDSITLIMVKEILDKHGWLGPDEVGEKGNSALFLVIQHANLETQEKYIPLLREAVKSGKARPSNLALMEDRMALRQGKLQIYGSQIGFDESNNESYVLPLQDPDNVDKRRSEVGLGPLSEYVSRWKIAWDIEAYKKKLPAYLEMQKK